MANLDIIEAIDTKYKEPNISTNSPRRTLRKRKSIAIDEPKAINRRVNMKPRKLLNCSNSKQIEALYLNKTVKTTSQTLETIYEEEKTEKNGSTSFIGGRKLKRLLTFQIGNQYSKEKIKKRRAKIKKLFGNKSCINRKKIPMNVFLKAIECLELDESIQPEPQANADEH